MKSETNPHDDELSRGDVADSTEATEHECRHAGPVPWWDDPANIPLLRQLVQEALEDEAAGRIVDGPAAFRRLQRGLRRRRSSPGSKGRPNPEGPRAS